MNPSDCIVPHTVNNQFVKNLEPVSTFMGTNWMDWKTFAIF